MAPVVKNLAANARVIRDASSIPGSGRSPGGAHGNPLQYCCLENPMDRGAWQVTVHRVAKSWLLLKWLSRHKSISDSPKCSCCKTKNDWNVWERKIRPVWLESNVYFHNAFILENEERRRWVCLIFTILYCYLEKKRRSGEIFILFLSKNKKFWIWKEPSQYCKVLIIQSKIKY